MKKPFCSRPYIYTHEYTVLSHFPANTIGSFLVEHIRVLYCTLRRFDNSSISVTVRAHVSARQKERVSIHQPTQLGQVGTETQYTIHTYTQETVNLLRFIDTHKTDYYNLYKADVACDHCVGVRNGCYDMDSA